MRSKKLSDDYTTTAEVMIDCIKRISSQKTKYHFCLYPTTSLISKKDLVKAFNKVKKQKSDLLLVITEFASNPLRALKLLKKNNLHFYFNKFDKRRTQDLPKLFQDSGSFYIYDTKSLLKNSGKITKKTTYYYLNRYKAIDIDNEIDFKFAELLHKLKKRK